jgi:TIR domain
MIDEQIIRNEANIFFEEKIKVVEYADAIENFHKIKQRLHDFYEPENKAIFLDQIEILIRSDLQSHRDLNHSGNSSPTCPIEIKTESFLFYIKQEIDTLPIIAHQKFQATDKASRNKVFVSYSHLDADFLVDVKRHFKPFLSQIDYWDDSKILPGQKWKEEIRKAIEETKVAILLVSTDFLGSDFIATNELPPLLTAAEKEGAIILIVIVKPCLFEEFNELNKFQAMNQPSKPVTKLTVDEKEELLVNLVRQTKKHINDVK